MNRTLAAAGIYASGLESGNDLEALFLELTGGEGTGEDGSPPLGVAGAAVGSHEEGAAR